ncbi:isochorismate synthase, partial [Candidatus Protofrankia californiensis]|uniref:isochorismate synthase n=1 Tax=Candidatus Protofrankia californiensis TaxID=1839754 RepID=UPI001040E487
VGTVLRALAANDPGCYVFAADIPAGPTIPAGPATGPGAAGSTATGRIHTTGGIHASGGTGRASARTLLGASPEMLVSRSGRLVVTNPLAGSAARSPDPAEDHRRAQNLLTSAKDVREHAVVVNAVVSTLRPYCLDLDVPARPSLIRTATMWHLSTRISGWLADPQVSSLTLATALHPTPAVCGWPAAAARRAIAEIEPFDRGHYTGLVGWCDASGDGEWAVAIRCAEADENSLTLFAGAGIVPGSQPSDELAETSAKFRTLLTAMGVDVTATSVDAPRQAQVAQPTNRRDS